MYNIFIYIITSTWNQPWVSSNKGDNQSKWKIWKCLGRWGALNIHRTWTIWKQTYAIWKVVKWCSRCAPCMYCACDHVPGRKKNLSILQPHICKFNHVESNVWDVSTPSFVGSRLFSQYKCNLRLLQSLQVSMFQIHPDPHFCGAIRSGSSVFCFWSYWSLIKPLLKSSWVFLSRSHETPSSRSSPYEFPDFAREAPVLRGFPYENLTVYPGTFPNLSVSTPPFQESGGLRWDWAPSELQLLVSGCGAREGFLRGAGRCAGHGQRMAQAETNGTHHVQKRIPNIHEQEKNTIVQYTYIYIQTIFVGTFASCVLVRFNVLIILHFLLPCLFTAGSQDAVSWPLTN